MKILLKIIYVIVFVLVSYCIRNVSVMVSFKKQTFIDARTVVIVINLLLNLKYIYT